MPASLTRSSLPLSLLAPRQKLRARSIALGAAVSVVAFAATFALALALTGWYRSSLDDAVADADVAFLFGVALVASAALGGFLAGISSRVTDSALGGVHAAIAFAAMLAVLGLGLGAWRLVAGASLTLPWSGATLFVVVACSVVAAIVAGRTAARRNADAADSA